MSKEAIDHCEGCGCDIFEGDEMKRGRGRPRTITDMREYKAIKQREYRARKSSPPKPSIQTTTEERNEE